MASSVRVFQDFDRRTIMSLLGQEEETLRNDIQSIINWCAKQPHFPEIPDELLIERFLTVSKFYVETAKSKIDMYYTVRTLIPEFYNQHPCGEAARRLEDVLCIIPVYNLTSTLSRIVCFKFKDYDPDHFDIVSFIAYFLSVIEIRLREDCCLTDIFICDFQGVTINHLLRVTPSLMKKLNFIIENVFAIRSKAIYLLNAPSFIDMLIATVSKYLKPKLVKRIVICKDLDQLHEAVPKNELPTDFDGSLLSLQEHQELWTKKFEQDRRFFNHLMSLHVNEKLRPGKAINSDILGIQGNFRKLSID